ncbi:hypothetical protein DL546_007275 [Coniochaeta pulveracea]|uniref:54S ribosomal protein L27, mitochondrial n=1 Tax=Coniochaeta pulveracea TaxID=177199 RepID=A0A420YAP0_9PEZI|nr:hypothetical protein DL546_007275 [Coniochaeta pulveracea]
MQPTTRLQAMFRKFRLTTKDVNKGYYKGNRTGTIGRHTKHGGFIIDRTKVRTFVVPEGLKDFKLQPFVTLNKEPVWGQFETVDGPRDPELYLAKWKSMNAVD